MSLDLYLYQQTGDLKEWEERKAASLKEADDMKGLIPLINEYYDEKRPQKEPVFHANITHNLNKMADEAGIYYHLWRPDEIGITKAKELIRPLKKARELMIEKGRQHWVQFEPSNKWGTYEGFMSFIVAVIAACEEYPEADVNVSR
jgi:hypothetical protein